MSSYWHALVSTLTHTLALCLPIDMPSCRHALLSMHTLSCRHTRTLLSTRPLPCVFLPPLSPASYRHTLLSAYLRIDTPVPCLLSLVDTSLPLYRHTPIFCRHTRALCLLVDTPRALVPSYRHTPAFLLSCLLVCCISLSHCTLPCVRCCLFVFVRVCSCAPSKCVKTTLSLCQFTPSSNSCDLHHMTQVTNQCCVTYVM